LYCRVDCRAGGYEVCSGAAVGWWWIGVWISAGWGGVWVRLGQGRVDGHAGCLDGWAGRMLRQWVAVWWGVCVWVSELVNGWVRGCVGVGG
jgi:hypothetical protein